MNTIENYGMTNTSLSFGYKNGAAALKYRQRVAKAFGSDPSAKIVSNFVKSKDPESQILINKLLSTKDPKQKAIILLEDIKKLYERQEEQWTPHFDGYEEFELELKELKTPFPSIVGGWY